MNRRDFMFYTATTTGVLIPTWLRAASTPCPPSQVNITGGSTTLTGCPGPTPQSDWIARSTAPGVIAAHGFDTDADALNWYNPGPNGTRVARDSTVYVTGSSLRFDLLASDPPTANIAGSWSPQTPTTVFGQTFSQNSTFYLQYASRISATMVLNLSNNQWDSNWKQIVIMQGTNGCAGLGIVHTHPGTSGSTLYVDCGGRGMYTDMTDPYSNQNVPHQIQQGWDLTTGPNWTNEPNSYSAAYTLSAAGPNAWNPPTDAWYTVYFKVHVGTLTANGATGPQDSTIEMWVAPRGQYYWNKVVSWMGGIAYDNSPSDGFNNIEFTPYMTALSKGASQDAHMWIDEFIVSTQPIAVPLAPAPT